MDGADEMLRLTGDPFNDYHVEMVLLTSTRRRGDEVLFSPVLFLPFNQIAKFGGVPKGENRTNGKVVFPVPPDTICGLK